MSKNNKKFEKLVTAFVNETFTDKGGDVAKFRSAITKLLFTPKLQWKSEEIRNNGGDNLLYTIHYILNYDTETTIKVYEYTDGTNCLDWGNHTLLWGTVDECKQFCSDKILEDFLKLCE